MEILSICLNNLSHSSKCYTVTNYSLTTLMGLVFWVPGILICRCQVLYCSAVCWKVFQLNKCINDPVKTSSVIFTLFAYELV